MGLERYFDTKAEVDAYNLGVQDCIAILEKGKKGE